MRNAFPLLAVVTALTTTLFSGPVAAQSSAVYSAAVPPSRDALERLNLRSEWSTNIPLDGRDDGLGMVQIVSGEQVFVQTRGGLLIALDASTGAKQWSHRYDRSNANIYPVAVTDKLIFAVNVTNLYCFHRYSGLLEFKFDTSGAASAGPVVDRDKVYLILGTSKVVAFRYPQQVVAPPIAKAPVPGAPKPLGNDPTPLSVTDVISGRYGMPRTNPLRYEPEFEAPRIPPRGTDSAADLSNPHRTPSISSLPRVSPPYTLYREVTTPSITVLTNLQQPYRRYPEHLRSNQVSPSIAVLPPSVARAFELSTLRDKGVEPEIAWTLRPRGRVVHEPVLSDPISSLSAPEVWLTTDGPLIYSVLKRDHSEQVTAHTSGAVAAPGAGPVAFGKDAQLGYFSLRDGTLLAIELTAGSGETPRYEWKANVGGVLNRKPVPVKEGVYTSGDHAGVAFVGLKSGDVEWRTEAFADRLLAINEEHVYIKDRRGNLLVYDKRKVADPVSRRAEPLTKLDVGDFSVPITNEQTDRIFLGSHNGLLVCLRDASAKYAKPLQVAPPGRQPPPAVPAPMPNPN